MRGMSVITITAALCLTATAQAQKTKKPTAGTNGAAKIQKASATLETATSSALKIAPASNDATSTASLQTNLPEQKRALGFSLLTFHDVNKGSISDKEPNAYGVWRPTVRYALNDHLTLSYRQEFQNSYATNKEEAKWHINDGNVQLLNSKIAKLPGDVAIDGFFRVYVPTGETSRFVTKRLTAFYGNLNATKEVGKFGFAYNFLAWYSVNSQDSYLVQNSKTKLMEPKANVDFSFENYVGTEYAISPKLAAGIQLGIVDTYYRGIPIKGVGRKTELYTEAGMTFKPVKNVSVGAAVFNQPSLEPNNAVKYFADADTYYRALLNVSL